MAKPKPIPREVLAQIPRGQRRAVQAAVRAIGGWDADVACGTNARYPRRTWQSTRALVGRIEDESGLDLGALDPACLRDAFCEPLGLHKPRSKGGSKRGARYCPDSRSKGGWKKALALALGSDRRFAEVPDRPEWRAFGEALHECEGRALTSSELEAVERHRDEVESCERQQPALVDELITRAKARALRPPRPRPSVAPRPRIIVIDDDDVPF